MCNSNTFANGRRNYRICTKRIVVGVREPDHVWPYAASTSATTAPHGPTNGDKAHE